ncbi:MAG: DUF2892 domain-containing protein [Nitrospirae bacterium]|nr:DUF2892 domain-containing protein [Nitrospirota bacterium]
MTCNLGGRERAIRVAVGMGLIGGALFVEQPGWVVGAMFVVGGIAMLTGLIGFCPAWKLFGRNTCRTGTSVRQEGR